MKKIVAAALLLPLLCGCSMQQTGKTFELCSQSWSVTQRGGARIGLCFDGDTACFSVNNGKEHTEIKGRYLATDIDFVIFMPQIAQNYRFVYTPRGKYLDLKYNGKTLTLKKSE